MVAAFLAAFALAQPNIRYYRSVEVMALSGASMVGVATRIQPPVTGGEQIKVDVVFKDCISINQFAVYPETGAFLSVSKDKVQGWIDSKARILSFNDGSWVNLDDPRERFVDKNLVRIPTADEFIRRLKLVYTAHPEIETVRVFHRPLTLAESARLDMDKGAYLGVPCDRSVEKWGQELAASKDWNLRMASLNALTYFRSNANEARVRRMLNDPFSVVDTSGKRTFPVRERAASLLEIWGIKA